MKYEKNYEYVQILKIFIQNKLWKANFDKTLIFT